MPQTRVLPYGFGGLAAQLAAQALYPAAPCACTVWPTQCIVAVGRGFGAVGNVYRHVDHRIHASNPGAALRFRRTGCPTCRPSPISSCTMRMHRLANTVHCGSRPWVRRCWQCVPARRPSHSCLKPGCCPTVSEDWLPNLPPKPCIQLHHAHAPSGQHSALWQSAVGSALLAMCTGT